MGIRRSASRSRESAWGSGSPGRTDGPPPNSCSPAERNSPPRGQGGDIPEGATSTLVSLTTESGSLGPVPSTWPQTWPRACPPPQGSSHLERQGPGGGAGRGIRPVSRSHSTSGKQPAHKSEGSLWSPELRSRGGKGRHSRPANHQMSAPPPTPRPPPSLERRGLTEPTWHTWPAGPAACARPRIERLPLDCE